MFTCIASNFTWHTQSVVDSNETEQRFLTVLIPQGFRLISDVCHTQAGYENISRWAQFSVSHGVCFCIKYLWLQSIQTVGYCLYCPHNLN